MEQACVCRQGVMGWVCRPLFRQPLFSRSSSTRLSFYDVLTLTLTIVPVGIAAAPTPGVAHRCAGPLASADTSLKQLHWMEDLGVSCAL